VAALIGAVVAVIVSEHRAGRDERMRTPVRRHRRRRGIAADNGDPDTMHYAVNRLVSEIGRIAVPTAASTRHPSSNAAAEPPRTRGGRWQHDRSAT
jgi:hypothetical protein